MKIFAFLVNLVLSKPAGGRQKRFCTASCAGETSDWISYLSNGVQATGKTSIMSRVAILMTDNDFASKINVKILLFKLT